MIFVQSKSHFIIASDKMGWLNLILNLHLYWQDKFCRSVYCLPQLQIVYFSVVRHFINISKKYKFSWFMEKNSDFIYLLHNSFIRFISNCDSIKWMLFGKGYWWGAFRHQEGLRGGLYWWTLRRTLGIKRKFQMDF